MVNHELALDVPLERIIDKLLEDACCNTTDILALPCSKPEFYIQVNTRYYNVQWEYQKVGIDFIKSHCDCYAVAVSPGTVDSTQTMQHSLLLTTYYKNNSFGGYNPWGDESKYYLSFEAKNISGHGFKISVEIEELLDGHDYYPIYNTINHECLSQCVIPSNNLDFLYLIKDLINFGKIMNVYCIVDEYDDDEANTFKSLDCIIFWRCLYTETLMAMCTTSAMIKAIYELNAIGTKTFDLRTTKKEIKPIERMRKSIQNQLKIRQNKTNNLIAAAIDILVDSSFIEYVHLEDMANFEVKLSEDMNVNEMILFYKISVKFKSDKNEIIQWLKTMEKK